MSWANVAIFGGTVASGLLTSGAKKSAAEGATQAEIEASELGIEEQRRQFDEFQKLLAPFIEAGESALTQQQALAGLAGEGPQQRAIELIEKSPQFESLTRAGEESILQRASATGGLRGGDVQSALAEFRPQILSDLIREKFSQFGGLSRLGQASAVGVGSAGQATSGNIAELLSHIGAARSEGILAPGAADVGAIGEISTGVGTLIESKF